MQINAINSSFSSTSIEVLGGQAGILRRQIHAEISTLKTECLNPFFTDPLSEKLKLWLDTFEKAMRLASNPQLCLDEYTEKLKKLLYHIEPFASVSFDDEIFLGTDSNSYGRKLLSILLAQMDEQERKHSPLSPNDSTPFFVRKHIPAQACYDWFKKRNIQTHSGRVEDMYQQLLLSGELPALPIQLSHSPSPINRINGLAKAVLLDADALEEEMTTLLKVLEHQPTRQQQIFDNAFQENEIQWQEHARQIDRLNERRAQFEQEAKEQLNQIQLKIKEIEQKGEEIDKRIENQIHQLDETEKANLYVQRGLNQLEALVKKHEESSMQGFLKFGLSFGVCLLLSQLTCYAAPGLSVRPIVGGGAIYFNKIF